jgi:YYY domain-containing protein
MLRDLIVWWLCCSALGWLAWPLAARVFASSPGRGYAYARAMGLAMLSYLYWLPGVLGLWPNQDLPLWGVTALLALGSLLLGLQRREELMQWLRREWRHVLATELLFFLVLAIYAWYKAHDPGIDHTEEPMDFAFLNAMLRSPQLPPHDPWLAGFKVSYYYLGYLNISLMARLSVVSSGVAYSLGLAQTLALAVVGGYGVLYDLLAGRRGARVWAVLGGLALGLAGNLEGALELLRSRGLGGEAFFRWLEIPGLAEAPVTGAWLPQGDWWWWRASRIMSDPNILGKTPTVITEFPAFSFILGDLHPHVMALPTLLLALGLAVEIYRTIRRQPDAGWWRRPNLWIMPLFYGALGMLNSWDLPTAMLMAGLAFAVGRWRGRVDGGRWLRDTVLWGAWLAIASIVLYLPFYRDLSSQAQGIGLAYYAKTPLKHYLVHFAPWILPILGVGAVAWRSLDAGGRRVARRLGLVLLFLPWLGTLIAGGWGRFFLGLATLVLRGPWLLLLQSALLAVLLAGLQR